VGSAIAAPVTTSWVGNAVDGWTQTEEGLAELVDPAARSEIERNLSGDDDGTGEAVHPNSHFFFTVTDGGGNVGQTVHIPGGQLAREEKMREFFEHQLDELQDQVAIADGKAVGYYKQYRSTLEQVDKLSSERHEQMKVLRLIKMGMERSRREYAAHRSNYEKQIEELKQKCAALEKAVQ